MAPAVVLTITLAACATSRPPPTVPEAVIAHVEPMAPVLLDLSFDVGELRVAAPPLPLQAAADTTDVPLHCPQVPWRAPAIELRVQARVCTARGQVMSGQPAAAVATLAPLGDDERVGLYWRTWAAWAAGDAAVSTTALVALATRPAGPGPIDPTRLRTELAWLAAQLAVPLDALAASSTGAAGWRAHAQARMDMGAWAEAADASGRAAVADAQGAADRVLARTREASNWLRAGEPMKAVVASADAFAGLIVCGDACAHPLLPTWRIASQRMAHFAHAVYAITHDAQYRDAAQGLWALVGHASTSPAERAAVQGEIAGLDARVAQVTAGTGTYDQGLVTRWLQAHAPAVRACTSADPAIDAAGPLQLELELDATGDVLGVASVPGPGDAGMARVAACVIRAARGWRLPQRTQPGTTRVRVTWTFASATP